MAGDWRAGIRAVLVPRQAPDGSYVNAGGVLVKENDPLLCTTLAVTAIVVSAADNKEYHYDQGVYYVPASGGYKVVPAPIGATVPQLPDHSVEVLVSGREYFYYGGAFYLASSGKYTVVEAPPGAVVSSLPDGTETVVLSGNTYFKYADTYYRAESQGGGVVYAVVAKPA